MRLKPVVLVLGLCALAACQSADVEELKKGQKEILAKLDNLYKAVAQVKAGAAAPARGAPDPNKVYTIPIGDTPVRGTKGAKAVVLEFADYQCPFCAQSTGLVDQVLEAYPKDVQYVYKQFPLPATMHPNALPASKAAIAAGKQGKFWEMHDIMFKNSRELSFDKLKEYAGQIGLDVARWEKDFAAPDVQAQIDKEMAEGRSADVQGTPTFFVNGKRLMNRSLDGFKQMIDDAIKAKG
jgi:protein-disulfide isomerase